MQNMDSYSAEVIFASVREALPLWQPKLKAVVIMCVDGEDWLCDGKMGIVEKANGAIPSNAELTVTMSLSTFQELMDKQLTAQQAFMKGKLKVKGNMGLAMKLTTVIGAAQKYLPKSKL
jgi:3-hydroxyacyl-CoA dehydrogenase/3a,7a,12a-trihydroxy-5b-cholest-24-enoyl-CoA hydratase